MSCRLGCARLIGKDWRLALWRVDLETPSICALRCLSLGCINLGRMADWQLDLCPARRAFRDVPEHLAGSADAAVTAGTKEPVFNARSHLFYVLKL